MHAITVKYVAPTDTKGAMMVATAVAGSISVNYRPRWNAKQNAISAVNALMRQIGLEGEYVIGLDYNGQWQAVFIEADDGSN